MRDHINDLLEAKGSTLAVVNEGTSAAANADAQSITICSRAVGPTVLPSSWGAA